MHIEGMPPRSDMVVFFILMSPMHFLNILHRSQNWLKPQRSLEGHAEIGDLLESERGHVLAG